MEFNRKKFISFKKENVNFPPDDHFLKLLTLRFVYQNMAMIGGGRHFRMHSQNGEEDRHAHWLWICMPLFTLPKLGKVSISAPNVTMWRIARPTISRLTLGNSENFGFFTKKIILAKTVWLLFFNLKYKFTNNFKTFCKCQKGRQSTFHGVPPSMQSEHKRWCKHELSDDQRHQPQTTTTGENNQLVWPCEKWNRKIIHFHGLWSAGIVLSYC